MRLLKNLLIYVAATIGFLVVMALPELLGNLIHWLGLDWLLVTAFFVAIPVGLYKGLNYLIDQYYQEKE